MISVPDKIKELLHLDSWKKNIRIHFPNGERADICNNQIVMDSTQFTDSLCSQNTLKFGLCESPIFQCEVVGVGNVKGATIEVFVEVYCDGSDTGALWRRDIQAFVYPISLGTFEIFSSRRQADIIHRKIVAYAENTVQRIASSNVKVYHRGTNADFAVDVTNSEVVKDVMVTQYGGELSFDPIRRLYARIGKNFDNALTFEEVQMTGINDEVQDPEYKRTNSRNYRFKFSDVPNSDIFQIRVHYDSFASIDKISTATNELFRVEPSDSEMTISEIYNDALATLEELYSNSTATGHITEEMYEAMQRNLFVFFYDKYDFDAYINSDDTEDGVEPFFMNGYVYQYGYFNDRYSFSRTNALYKIPIKDDCLYVYPKINTSNSADTKRLFFYVPFRIDISFTWLNSSSSTTKTIQGTAFRNSARGNQLLHIKKALCDYFGLISRTQKRFKANFKNNYGDYFKGYQLDNSINNDYYNKLLNDYLQMRGLFGKVSRVNRAISIVSIKQLFGLDPSTSLYPSDELYPEAPVGGTLRPEDYQSCWYDDDYTKPFGAVECSYKNTDNIDCTFTLYLVGYNDLSDTDTYQTFVLKDNEIISQKTWTQSQIQTICNGIADNIDGVTYLPVEFVGRGLPYVEAGDTYEVLTASNDIITTIVLSRTMKGEMHLVDSYKSV